VARFDDKLSSMAVIISMLRGVNLGPYNRIKMEALRELYSSLRLRDPQTYVQSGNVIFGTEETNLYQLAKRIEKAIEREFGFQSDVILRTTAELRRVIARNPFAKRKGIEPRKFLVNFLAREPGADACEALRSLKSEPEEVFIDGRELYIYYPNGMARPKLSWPTIDRILRTRGTGRNWNSVTKLLELAEKLEAAAKSS
jgi:uncharacterized protein (DUF1697 family)